LNPAQAQYLPTNLPTFGLIRLVTIFDDFGLTAAPFPDLSPFPQSLNAMNKHWKAPYSEQWNLNIQQGLGSNMVLQVGYVGNQSLHLSPIQEINPITNGQRRYPGFTSISQYPTCCSANYNALQVSFKQRALHGLTYNVNYTYSHSLDHGGLSFGPAAQNPDDYNAEYGTSDYDVRHNLQIDYTYELPGAPRLPHWLGGGWQINGITIMRSALPVDVVCGCDPTGIGAANGRPNYTGAAPVMASNIVWPGSVTGSQPHANINIAAFSAPVGTFGNVPRNVAKGPALFNSDFSLFKNFLVSEGKTVQFRAELFNIFNTPQFANPDGTMTGPAFGVSTSTITSSGGFGSYRQIQFALKFLF
jgi:hypothetical protein